MAVSETAVAIAIAKMGTEPICLRRRNRKRQWEWLHRLQCNQSLLSDIIPVFEQLLLLFQKEIPTVRSSNLTGKLFCFHVAFT